VVQKPKAPPPRKKAPPKPEEILSQKLEIAIHKIGGLQELSLAEMTALWDFPPEAVDAKAVDLINDKLRQTASLGNCAALEFLLAKKGDVNAQCPFTGNTPLMQAVGVTTHLEKQKKVITFLMENGADCNIRNNMKLTPKSATPGMPDNPLVTLTRELDLKIKDLAGPKAMPEPTVYHPPEEDKEEE
jgi:hypothetical protein